MREEAAYRVVREWEGAHRNQEIDKVRGWKPLLVAALELVPEDAQCAVETGDDSFPRLLVLADKCLWRFTVVPIEAADGPQAEVRTEYVLVSGRTHQLIVTLAWDSQADSFGQPCLRRTYQLERSGVSEPIVSVVGSETLRRDGSRPRPLDREEKFGRALAAALGWDSAGAPPD